MIARESQFLTRAPAKFSFSSHTHSPRSGLCFFFGMLELCVARFVMQIFVLSWSERQFGKWAFSALCVCALVVVYMIGFDDVNWWIFSRPHISLHTWIISCVRGWMHADRRKAAGWAGANAKDHCFHGVCVRSAHALNECSHMVLIFCCPVKTAQRRLRN